MSDVVFMWLEQANRFEEHSSLPRSRRCPVTPGTGSGYRLKRRGHRKTLPRVSGSLPTPAEVDGILPPGQSAFVLAGREAFCERARGVSAAGRTDRDAQLLRWFDNGSEESGQLHLVPGRRASANRDHAFDRVAHHLGHFLFLHRFKGLQVGVQLIGSLGSSSHDVPP